MLDYSNLILFSVAAMALAVSPGPDMILIASRSVAQGRVAGLATWAGIAAGTYCHAIAAAFGLSELFLAVPVAYDIVRFAGAAYLLYLAWKAFTSKPVSGSDGGPAKRLSIRSMFSQGLLTNILNPKIAIFTLALYPQFIDAAAGSIVLQILIMATILNLSGLMVTGVLIAMSGGIRTVFAGNIRAQKISQYVLGTVFGGLAIRLAFDSQR